MTEYLPPGLQPLKAKRHRDFDFFPGGQKPHSKLNRAP